MAVGATAAFFLPMLAVLAAIKLQTVTNRLTWVNVKSSTLLNSDKGKKVYHEN